MDTTESRDPELTRSQEDVLNEKRVGAQETPLTSALRKALGLLSQAPSLDNFLEYLIRASAESFRADEIGLWVYDRALDQKRLVMNYAIGSVTKGTGGHIPSQMPDDLELYQRLERRDATGIVRHVFQEEDFEVEPCLAPYLQHLRSNRIKTLIRIPFSVREEFRGTLIMRFTSRHVPSAQEETVISGIADLITLALELTHLSEESREAAIVREREHSAERRTAELVKANKAIRKSLAKLLSHATLESFLGDALKVIASTLGASGGAIWLYDPHGNDSRLLLCLENGVVQASENGANPLVECPVSRLSGSPTSHHFEYHLRGEIRVDYEHDFRTHPNYQPYREYIKQRRIASLASVPLFLGDSVLGSIILKFEHAHQFSAQEEELGHAFSNQVTLALELTRLADESRDAAVARERELAAQQRATELANAKQIVAESLDALAADPELERYLAHIVKAIATQLEAQSSTLWLHDRTEREKAAHPPLDPESLHLSPDSQAEKSQRITFGLSPFHDLLQKQTKFHSVDRPGTPLSDAQRSNLLSSGTRGLLLIPLLFGGDLIGNIEIRLRTADEPACQRVELALSLAQQATLAIEMARLAGEARKAGILEERNRIARDLHDTLAQGFTGILAQLGAAEASLKAGRDMTTIDRLIRQAQELARSSLAETRASVLSIRHVTPVQPKILALEIERLLSQMTDGTPIRARIFQFNTSEAQTLPNPIGETLRRIVQETLTNTLKYAAAANFTVHIFWEKSAVRLETIDDGAGFFPDSNEHDGFGLLGMQERVSALSGSFEVRSRPGHGTTIRAQIPLTK